MSDRRAAARIGFYLAVQRSIDESTVPYADEDSSVEEHEEERKSGKDGGTRDGEGANAQPLPQLPPVAPPSKHDRFPLERQRASSSGMSTPERMGSTDDVHGKRSRTSTMSSCASCSGTVAGSPGGVHATVHSGQLQRANRPSPILIKGTLSPKLSTQSECICVPPVLLSPVLSRPVRSQSAASSPLPTRSTNSDSDGDFNVAWRVSGRRSTENKPGSRTNTPTMSPILNRSTSATRLAASFAANRSSSGSGLLLTAAMRSSGSGAVGMLGPAPSLRRTDSDAAEAARRRRRARRRPSFLSSHGMCSETSMDSCSSSTTNLTKMRSSLGHSDPQISASSMHNSVSAQSNSPSAMPVVRTTKDVLSLSQRGARQQSARRSLNASASPVLAPRCRSPHGRQLLPTAPVGAPSTSSARAPQQGAPTIRSYSTRSGSSLMAPAHDNRRWSLASLPSTSGYGTPGSNSAFSSQYSSSEQLCELLEGMKSGMHVGGSGSGGSANGSGSHHHSHSHHSHGHGHSHHSSHGHHHQHGSSRFDSNDSSVNNDDSFNSSSTFRPRSRSLTSPAKFAHSEFTADVVSRNSVYKERFPRAKEQMEERLTAFVSQNAPLSGGPSCTVEGDEACSSSSAAACGGGGAVVGGARSRRSMVLTAETTLAPALLRLIADGATRFLHHQLVEIASDCLQRSREDTITCAYFCEMSQRLEETLNEATAKTSGDSFDYLNKLVRQLLMIVSRPARLLECLEFDPDEFYQLLEEAEGVVREQLGSGSARVPDLPQYIIGKLGLDRDPLLEAQTHGHATPPGTPMPPMEQDERDGGSGREDRSGGGLRGPESVPEKWQQRAPCEEDLETIRLVSNGAYGAVYLVRHRETRQRFALKKMNKQTLMLRNQIDQVFAERDILTMTDNPFVVSFYGSFETRHHLCMLMEYVEGGDCASLLKNAGTLPVDLARLYVAETILAIEYLHSYGVVHRDLKPDNLLITAMGHIKLTDFGLSKIGLMNRTTLVAEEVLDLPESTQQFKDKQLCGTPEYIAPEVILRQGYGKPVDWWALGIICYEFLVGCVPFYGESPEDLFSKVITEEVEYPDGEEALPFPAESLIRHLLEKNPMERIGSVTGAAELMAHEFFVGLDFNTLLRQKAEFVPQLENDEDTSYFDTRSDRYNHEAESCGEEDASSSSAPMFHSFSTASPRHSIVGLEPGPLLPPDRIAACTSPLSQDSMSSGSDQHSSHSTCIPTSPSPTLGSMTASSSHRRPTPPSSSHRCLPPQAQSSEEHSTTDSMNDVPDKYACPMPSAILLRRRFSAQRQSNLSTSSSGTTGTGHIGTAPSSTDSSMDAFMFSDRRSVHGEEGRLRTDSTSTVASSISRRSPLPRFAISCDPDEEYSGGSAHGSLSMSGTKQCTHELSPVDEASMSVVRPRSVSSVDRLSGSLQLMIPSGSASPSSLCHGGQLSPGAASASSASSVDGVSPLPMDSAAPSSSHPPLSPHALKAPIFIKKGARGFGFTIRSVRVYLSEQSDYYTIEHIVSSVDEGGPAFEAGLRPEDMITHVNGQAVHNVTHPHLMTLMLATGTNISLKVMPLSATGIREGGPRKSVGKLAKKQKPKCPKRRLPCEKKPRKPSALLRRLSGKRATGDIVPGSSTQKQTFMPRSVSSQDGTILQQQTTVLPTMTQAQPSSSSGVPGTVTSGGGGGGTGQPAFVLPQHAPSTAAQQQHKRMSDVGLPREDHRSPLVSSCGQPLSPAGASTRPSSLTGLKPKSVFTPVPPSSSSTSTTTYASSSSSHTVPSSSSAASSSFTTVPPATSTVISRPGLLPSSSVVGGGGTVQCTSPMPVSPLARPSSPRPVVSSSQQAAETVTTYAVGELPARPLKASSASAHSTSSSSSSSGTKLTRKQPPSSTSTSTSNVRGKEAVHPPTHLPPPLPPASSSSSSVKPSPPPIPPPPAARNLMQRLLHPKD